MRLEDVRLGEVLVTGPARDMQEGLVGVVVIALAVGRYTRSRVPCGYAVTKTERGRPEVVVARPRVDQFTPGEYVGRRDRSLYVIDLKHITPQTNWDLGIINGRSLMPYDEWRRNRDAVEELREMDAAHNREGDRLKLEMQRITVDALGMGLQQVEDISSFSTYRVRDADGRGGWGPTILLDAEEVGQLLACTDPVAWEKVEALKDRYLEWRAKPAPSTCASR